MFLETNYAGPGLFDYHLQKNEYLAEDKDLCNAYDQLQKDCEDLKHLMEIFSNEIYVNTLKKHCIATALFKRLIKNMISLICDILFK